MHRLETEVSNAMAGDTPPTPYERSYWVVPGKLLAGAYPGDIVQERAEAKLHAMIAAGIRCFVDLTTKNERNLRGEPLAPYDRLVRKVASTGGFKVFCHRKPITMLDVPTHEEMVEILDVIDGAVSSDLPVYVHCLGGLGRTGTVVGCWLVRHGIAAGEAALDCIQTLRRQDTLAHVPSPETAHQRRFICEWKEAE